MTYPRFKMPIMALVLALCLAGAARAEDWKNINTATDPKMPGDEIQFLAAARGGGIWVGTLSGIARRSNGTFTPVADGKGQKLGLQAWCVLEDKAGTAWIGHGNGVLRLGADGSQAHTLPGNTVAPILQVGDDIWALAKQRGSETNRIMIHRDGEWQPLGGLKQQVVDLFVDSKGTVWATLDGNGVLQIDPAKGAEAGIPHLEGFNVTTVSEDNRGQIWCGLWSRGVAVYDDTQWSKHLTNLKDSAILAIRQDRKGNMWLATSANGVWWRPFNKQEWQNELADEGAINLLVTTADGRVWISSQMVGGLRYRKDDTWVISMNTPLPIRCLVETNDHYWAGGVLDGLHTLPKN